jgi:hypothetical protein
MQKVEGSSPFSRFQETPLRRGFRMLGNGRGLDTGAPGQAPGQELAEHRKYVLNRRRNMGPTEPNVGSSNRSGRAGKAPV